MVLRGLVMNQLAFSEAGSNLVEVPVGIERNRKEMSPPILQYSPDLLVSLVGIGDMFQNIAGENIIKGIVSKGETLQVLVTDAFDELAGVVAIGKILTALISLDQA
jgi:hypothetical protein